MPFEPKVTPSPKKSSLPIGGNYALHATVVNVGSPTLDPVPGFDLRFVVHEGPNQGLEFGGVTDGQGQLQFAYTSTSVGTDRIAITLTGEGEGMELADAEVRWTGGPDLVIPYFIPPVIESQGGRLIELREETSNIGLTPASPSTTHYYLSAASIVDPATARLLAVRAVPALAPGAASFSGVISLPLPADLPAGTYHLAACADAPREVIELEEQNNCSFSIVHSISRTIVPSRTQGGVNQAPVCTTAVPSINRLWPPNHKLAAVTIQGVQDPDNDPLTIHITRIRQDEPVNGLGDGDTSPDGFGLGTGEAQVRKERSGTSNGRIYAIGFEATDGRGGRCTGSVSVGVPHDQSPRSTPIDNGQNYDSTQS